MNKSYSKSSVVVNSKYAQRKLRVSVVDNVQDKNPRRIQSTWEKLIKKCHKPEKRGKLRFKDYLKADKEIQNEQKNGKAMMGGLSDTRKRSDLKNISIVPLDLDEGEITFKELVKALKKLRIECVVHTTYSHSVECSKFRILVLLDRPIRKHFDEILDEINNYFESALGVSIDRSSRNPVQLFYVPAHPPGGEEHYRCQHIKGKALDPDDFEIQKPTHDELIASEAPIPSDCLRPGDDYSVRVSVNDISALLKSRGWRVCYAKNGLIHYTRPGKKKGVSATYGFNGTKLLYIHSSNPKVQPFKIGKSYNPFAVYTLIEHNGDFKAAASQLRKKGYGQQHQFNMGGSHTNASISESIEWPELHEDALPGLVGEVVALACDNTEIHPAAVLTTFLLRFSAEINGPYFSVGDSKQKARTNAVIVGSTSRSRKGTSTKPVERIFDGLENSAQCSPGPISTGEGLINIVRDEVMAYDKKTGEMIVTDPGVSDKRLFVLEEEFAATLTCSKREGNTLSAIIRGFFDKGDAAPITRHNKIQTTGAHVVILAHITRDELTSLLNRTQIANGFANRFLWVLVRRTEEVPCPEPMPEEEVKRFQAIVAKLIAAAKNIEEMKMSKRAKQLYIAEYPRLTIDYPGAAGSVVCRSEAHVVRLAMIYAMLAGHKQIKVQDLKAALALVEYSRKSAFIIFAGKNGKKIDDRVDRVLNALREAPDNALSRTDISRVFHGKQPKEQIYRLLETLESENLITIEKAGNAVGAPKEMIKLCCNAQEQ